VPNNPKPKSSETLKAGALLCPVCCVEYIEAEVDLEFNGEVLRNIKVLRCPVCQEEQFTQQQQDEIEARLSNAKP
jgi:hypothetical protein